MKIMSNYISLKKLFFVSFIFFSLSTVAQVSYFGRGLEFGDKESNYYMKFSSRLQSRFDGTFDEADSSYSKKYRFRRARLKFDGFAFSPKLVYKIEYDLINSQMLDAVIKWNFAGNMNLWIGQTKLPGNRERVISSQKLQFVDRSLLNSKLNIDRDEGIQLRNHFNVGNWVLRQAFSISKGEGRIYKGENFGNDYTARFEILPFGKFASKGDYFSADLKREPEPKLALGITYDYNNNAIKSRGQLGSVLTETRDLETVFIDMMYKHKGLSVMAEYANKQVNNASPLILNTDGELIESFYTGSAINVQLGYLFKNNWEVSARYTMVSPERITPNNELRQYTFGLSRYIVGHNLKIQSDFSLLKEASKADKRIIRLQLELAF